MSSDATPSPPAPPARSGALERVVVVLLALYVVAVGANSLLRTRSFSPDSMNYVAVAREIRQGHGWVQPTLGFVNQPRFAPDAPIPAPSVAQGPLYPGAIALVASLGPSEEDAALLLPVLGLGAILTLTFALTRRLYDTPTAWLALAVLGTLAPLRLVGGLAWSEAPGLGLALGSNWLVLVGRPGLGGFVAGLAALTRYALLPPVALAGGLFVWVTASSATQRWRSWLLFGGGLAIPLTAWAVRNWLAVGAVLPSANPTHTEFDENLVAALVSVLASFLGGVFQSESEAWLLGLLALLALGGFAWRQRGNLGAALGDLAAGPRLVPIVWGVAYLLFFVWQRSTSHVYEVSVRLTLPTVLALVPALSRLLLRSYPAVASWAPWAAAAVVVLGLVREAQTFAARPRPDPARIVQGSPRLGWLASQSTNDDLIIGDDTVDLPFYLHRPKVISYSPYPLSDRPTYEGVLAIARARCAQHRAILLVLRRGRRDEAAWRVEFGTFFADVAAGRLADYPALQPVADLPDARIFLVRCR